MPLISKIEVKPPFFSSRFREREGESMKFITSLNSHLLEESMPNLKKPAGGVNG